MSSELDVQVEDDDAQVDDDLRVAALTAQPAKKRRRREGFAVALGIALACHGALAAAWVAFGPGSGPPELAIRSGRGGAVGYGSIDDDAPLVYTAAKPSDLNVPVTKVPTQRMSEVVEDNPPVAYTPATEQAALRDFLNGSEKGTSRTSAAQSTPTNQTMADILDVPFSRPGAFNTNSTGGGGDGLAVTGEGLRSRFANDPPEYPLEARRRRMEGTVTLAIVIDATGRVAEARIARSSGHALLDHSALAKALTYKIPPYRENGVAMDVQLVLPFTFKLRG